MNYRNKKLPKKYLNAKTCTYLYTQTKHFRKILVSHYNIILSVIDTYYYLFTAFQDGDERIAFPAIPALDD